MALVDVDCWVVARLFCGWTDELGSSHGVCDASEDNCGVALNMCSCRVYSKKDAGGGGGRDHYSCHSTSVAGGVPLLFVASCEMLFESKLEYWRRLNRLSHDFNKK